MTRKIESKFPANEKKWKEPALVNIGRARLEKRLVDVIFASFWMLERPIPESYAHFACSIVLDDYEAKEITRLSYGPWSRFWWFNVALMPFGDIVYTSI